MAPGRVVPISEATVPEAEAAAAAKSSKLIFPLEAMSRTSEAVTPYCLARACQIGTPRSANWFMTSVSALPADAALLKIAPMSAMETPAAAAVLATVLRTPSSWSPGWMPAATAEAATVAASPRPNAVPLTDAEAFFMIESTAPASLPRPRSLARAVSMACRRENPPVRAVPRPAAAAPTAAVAGPDRAEASAEAALDAPEATAPTTEDMPDAIADAILAAPDAAPCAILAVPEARVPTIRAVPEARAPTIREAPEATAPTMEGTPEARAGPRREPTAAAACPTGPR